MTSITIVTLTLGLFVLIFLSSFFSCAETALMAINRYRLRHLAKQGNCAALRVSALLERPERLLGVVLIGNNLSNILASAIATVMALHLFGEIGVAFATAVLSLLILVFAEVAPKTLGAAYPLRMAFLVSWPLMVLLRMLYPLVVITNVLSNGFLRLCGVSIPTRKTEELSQEELRTIVYESGGLLSPHYRKMLLSTLDLAEITVDDIMIPYGDIVGIDLNDDWNNIITLLAHSQHTRLPVFRDTIDEIQGILHVRKILAVLTLTEFNKDKLLEMADPPYFVPQGTPLNIQLLNFQKVKQRLGFIVDEYGSILGLVTLEDILEEIVGEFTTHMATTISRMIHPQGEDEYVVDGSLTIRELNRALGLQFPLKGPKTLNGLITEVLEMIPNAGTCVRIKNYPVEIMKVEDNIVRSAKISIRKLPKRLKSS